MQKKEKINIIALRFAHKVTYIYERYFSFHIYGRRITVMQSQVRSDIRTSGQVDPKSKSKDNTEYRVDKTLYQVKSVFTGNQNAEPFEDKIKRLILEDKNCKQLAM